MSARKATIDAALAALRRDYAASLPDRVAHLTRAVRAWRAAPDDPRLCEGARDIAHRLRGTIGSFGLTELCAIVGAVEDALVRAATTRAEAGAPAWEEIDALLLDADTCAARLSQEVGT